MNLTKRRKLNGRGKTIVLLMLGSATSAAFAQAASPESPLGAIQTMNRELGKIVSANGIDEAKYVSLGGARQWITIRGQDRRAPILLYLHGGPGSVISDWSYMFQRPWEDYFTVVHWDQRGFGRSEVDGVRLVGTINKEQYVADTIALIDLLRRDLGQAKVIVMGQSWGTVLALEIARRRPDLIHAVVSVGQVVDEKQNFVETRRLLIEDARARGDTALERKLSDLGPMPSIDDWDRWLAWLRVVQTENLRQGHSWHSAREPAALGARILAGISVSPNLVDHPVEKPTAPFPGGRAAKDKEINLSIDDWTAEKDIGTRLAVPLVMISGRHDWQTPITLARAYFDKLCAPYKKFVEFPHSAHIVLLEEPGRTLVTLVNDVLPAVRGDVPEGATTCPPPR